MGGTKQSMIAGAPRNLTLAEQQLVRGMGDPPVDVHVPLDPPTPARIIPVTVAPRGARAFAAAAKRAGFRVEVCASNGPLLDTKGSSTRNVHVVSVRCFTAESVGRAVIVACWNDGSYEMALGRRADGSRRAAMTLKQAKAWLDYGVEGDIPHPRVAARLVVAALGGRLIGTQDRATGERVCPVPQTDTAAADHLELVHKQPPVSVVGSLDHHAALHEETTPRHVHSRRPLGEPPQ